MPYQNKADFLKADFVFDSHAKCSSEEKDQTNSEFLGKSWKEDLRAPAAHKNYGGRVPLRSPRLDGPWNLEMFVLIVEHFEDVISRFFVKFR